MRNDPPNQSLDLRGSTDRDWAIIGADQWTHRNKRLVRTGETRREKCARGAKFGSHRLISIR